MCENLWDHTDTHTAEITGNCVEIIRQRSWWTWVPRCCSSTWRSSWTAGWLPMRFRVCAWLWLPSCTSSFLPHSPGWALSPSTCTSPWSRSSTPTSGGTSSSSALLDGVSHSLMEAVTHLHQCVSESLGKVEKCYGKFLLNVWEMLSCWHEILYIIVSCITLIIHIRLTYLLLCD